MSLDCFGGKWTKICLLENLNPLWLIVSALEMRNEVLLEFNKFYVNVGRKLAEKFLTINSPFIR